MRTLNSINVGFKSITTNFAGLLLFLVQCTSWYNGDNTFTFVKSGRALHFITQIYRKVVKLFIHGIIVKYD